MSTPNLSPHLHTEECNEIIANWFKCREEAGYMRFFNRCGQYPQLIRDCTKKEKLAKYRAQMAKVHGNRKRQNKE